MLGMPRGTTLENLTFNDILENSSAIVASSTALKELYSRAQGEVSIREALRELELWGASTEFTLTDYEDSQERKMVIIKEWKEVVNQVWELYRYLYHDKLWYKRVRAYHYNMLDTHVFLCHCSVTINRLLLLLLIGWGPPVSATESQGLSVLQRI